MRISREGMIMKKKAVASNGLLCVPRSLKQHKQRPSLAVPAIVRWHEVGCISSVVRSKSFLSIAPLPLISEVQSSRERYGSRNTRRQQHVFIFLFVRSCSFRGKTPRKTGTHPFVQIQQRVVCGTRGDASARIHMPLPNKRGIWTAGRL